MNHRILVAPQPAQAISRRSTKSLPTSQTFVMNTANGSERVRELPWIDSGTFSSLEEALAAINAFARDNDSAVVIEKYRYDKVTPRRVIFVCDQEALQSTREHEETTQREVSTMPAPYGNQSTPQQQRSHIMVN